MKKIAFLILVIIAMAGCATTQLSTPEDIAHACSYQYDPYKKSETLYSPNIKVDVLCNYYYKWNRINKEGDGSYAIELYFTYNDGAGISELRDLDGNTFKPLQSTLIDVKSMSYGVLYNHCAVFSVNRSFLNSIEGVKPFRIYTEIGLDHDIVLEQTHIQGFLNAVDTKVDSSQSEQ